MITVVKLKDYARVRPIANSASVSKSQEYLVLYANLKDVASDIAQACAEYDIYCNKTEKEAKKLIQEEYS